jgi:hypothetical protein
VLGILWVVFSALRIAPGLGLLFLGHGHLPFVLMPLPVPWHAFMGRLLSALALGVIGFAILGLIAGVGLLTCASWARILAVVLGCINLIHIPFGTALGIYTLWVLLSPGAEREYRSLSAP